MSETRKLTVLVLGASGTFGRRIVELLVANGRFAVLCARRKRWSSSWGDACGSTFSQQRGDSALGREVITERHLTIARYRLMVTMEAMVEESTTVEVMLASRR